MAAPAWANNIQVTNVVLVDQDTGADVINIRFDISWDNSWRLSGTQAPSNRDAAWVFAKWRVPGGNWAHCTLSTTDLDHTAPTGSQIDASFSKDNTGKGVFIFRDSEGTGSNNWSGVKLYWDYGTDGMGDNDVVEVRVFAIEMVYVPQGAFYVGDADNDVKDCFHDGDDTGPYQVTGEGAITVGTGNGELYYDYNHTSGGGDQSGPIPADFPKGYNSFYAMKYEISQGQYADFLNTLTRDQQNPRTYSDVSTNAITNIYVMSNQTSVIGRNTITCPASGNGTTDPITFSVSTPDRACNYLSWMDDAAYADWAGIRPMTGLEFEKICRGTQSVVDDEYVWGNANIATAAYTLANDGQPGESIAANYANDPTGNAMYTHTIGSIGGPLRCGIFATATSSRAEAGAGYYGAMEMSGNLFERPVTLGNATGRGFTGSHGDGALSVNGDADVLNWPGLVSGEVTGADGSGSRGGGFFSSVLEVAFREGAANTYTGRDYIIGFRAVRTE